MRTNTFITRIFSDIYPDMESFKEDVTKYSKIKMTDEEQEDLFFMIYSRYGNSNLRYTDEFLFSLRLFNHINIFYPKVLAIKRDQIKLRESTDAELQYGGKTIQNQAQHNTADIANDTSLGVPQIDGQTVSILERSKLGVLQERLFSYTSGEEDVFLKDMYILFVQVIAPLSDLLFATHPFDEEEGD